MPDDSKDRRSRVLIVSPVPTHPGRGGNHVRVRELLRSLQALGYDAHLLHITRETGDSQAMHAAWKDRFHQFTYKLPALKFRRRLRKVARWFGSNQQYQYGIDEWWDPQANSFVLALHDKWQFDVVIAEYVFFSAALSLFDDKTVRLLDTHDVFTNRYRLFQENNSRPQWFSTNRFEEKAALCRADAVLAIQDEEAKWFKQITTKPIITVGHPVSLATNNAGTTEAKTPLQLLYVGSASTVNVESLNWFIEMVLPELRKMPVPTFQLTVVGKVGDHSLSCPELVTLGQVESLDGAYQEASIVLNPTRLGTGLKIKTIEALGQAKPLVTTSIGAAGLSDGKDKNFLVADEPKEFATAIESLLVSADLRQKMGKAAREYAAAANVSATARLHEYLQEHL